MKKLKPAPLISKKLLKNLEMLINLNQALITPLRLSMNIVAQKLFVQYWNILTDFYSHLLNLLNKKNLKSIPVQYFDRIKEHTFPDGTPQFQGARRLMFVHITVVRAASLYAALTPLFNKIVEMEHKYVISLDNASQKWKDSDNGNRDWKELEQRIPVQEDDKILGYLHEFGILPGDYEKSVTDTAVQPSSIDNDKSVPDTAAQPSSKGSGVLSWFNFW